jgi:hypothetical protein
MNPTEGDREPRTYKRKRPPEKLGAQFWKKPDVIPNNLPESQQPEGYLEQADAVFGEQRFWVSSASNPHEQRHDCLSPQ